MICDELGIGVKCQSNPEIAGSPRNIFRYSLSIAPRGRALDRSWGESLGPNQTSNTGTVFRQSQSVRAKLHWTKGQQPRPSAKVPKCNLSGKGCRSSKTARRLA